jgi:M6 family metalloprotease-like protein
LKIYHNSTRRCASLIGVFVLIAAIASADPPYPNPLPAFTPLGLPGYTGSPLGSLFTPVGGTRIRPVLVVRGFFADFPSLPAWFTPSFIESQVFGSSSSSIASYLTFVSRGRGGITRAVVSTSCSSIPGVVTVNLGRWSDFLAVGNDVRGQRMIRRLDPCVNFAAFDTNRRDGRITNDELVIVNHYVTGLADDDGGQAATLNAPVTVDGVTFPATASTVAWPHLSNVLTGVHELMHALYEAPDLYGFGVGSFDVLGPTVGGPMWFAPSAWTRMHLGWLTPQVATRDQWVYFQPSLTNGQASLLYDPVRRDKGDYFMVEYRRRSVGGYDQNIPEENGGLVIWRADVQAWRSPSVTMRPIELMRSDGVTTPGCSGDGVCYGGSEGDAWYACRPAPYNQRTMNRPWRDGTPAGVAVRAIGRLPTVSGFGTIRAWLDTAGPGILVETFSCNWRLPTLNQTQLDFSTVLRVLARNTGNQIDQFRFTLGPLPAGWWSKEVLLLLSPGKDTEVRLEVHAPLATLPVIQALHVNAVSLSKQTVQSTSPVIVAVGKAQGSAPQVVLVAPASGSTKGKTRLGVVGVNLSKTMQVKVGGQLAPSFKVVSDGYLEVVTPPGAGKKHVQVVLTNGLVSVADGRSAFTYTTPQPLYRRAAD